MTRTGSTHSAAARPTPARRRRRRLAPVVAVLAVIALVTSCAATSGTGAPATDADVPGASLSVVGDSNSTFDDTVKNALSDVMRFWASAYPQVDDGKALPTLKGRLYSVDGGNPSSEAKENGCLKEEPDAVEDNAFYCSVDDSIAWDRDPKHLVPVLGQDYGNYLVAMVFAHEFGHAIQERLGIFGPPRPPTIDTESEADCAAGAFTAWVITGHSRYFKITPAQLDKALSGYLQVRDPVPASTDKISHGNGFDRLGAVQDGIQHGVTFCYSKDYFDRKFTERPYTNDTDYDNNGNLPLNQILNDSGGGLFTSLNAYWKAKAGTISKNWTDVKTVEADHPKCGADANSEFGYCPDDNTVYYSSSVAQSAYNSISVIGSDQDTGDIAIKTNQPGDYALGTLFVIGWGLAVRHQLFNRSLDDGPALLAASCYAGAYSSSINVANTNGFALSPADMDEATSAMLDLVPQDRVFGDRNTSALERVQKFRTGYFGGLQAC